MHFSSVLHSTHRIVIHPFSWLVFACTSIGCAAEPLVDPCTQAAEQPLDVALGENREQELVLLDENVEPTAEMGAQGGSHLLLGVRVQNPVMEDFTLDATATAMTATNPCDAPCTDYRVEGFRNLYIDDPVQYTMREDGSLDILGMLIFLETWELDRIRTVTLEAVDQCGRISESELTW